MPLETRRFAKTALVFLFLTFAAGTALTFAHGAGIAVPAIIGVEHAHLGTVGFLVNIVIGIALWMLPLDRERFPQTQGRYPIVAPALCWWMLNGGLVVRLIAEPLQQLQFPSSVGLSGLLDAAAVAQLVAIAIFAGIAWHRIRPAIAGRAGTRA
ncbi:MAG: hypothetical protein ACRENA_10730 [Vulcanimicrobiaceae bacterium]